MIGALAWKQVFKAIAEVSYQFGTLNFIRETPTFTWALRWRFSKALLDSGRCFQA